MSLIIDQNIVKYQNGKIEVLSIKRYRNEKPNPVQGTSTVCNTQNVEVLNFYEKNLLIFHYAGKINHNHNHDYWTCYL